MMPSDEIHYETVRAMLPGITSRKMMGEYLLYKEGKLFGGIYDNRLLVKITKASATMLREYPSDFPYQGGGEMIFVPYSIDPELLRRVVDAMCQELPDPKAKKK